MNLCQKCYEAIKKEVLQDQGITFYGARQIFLDAECEFWAHKAFNVFARLNGWRTATEAEKAIFLKILSDLE